VVVAISNTSSGLRGEEEGVSWVMLNPGIGARRQCLAKKGVEPEQ